MAFTSDNCNVMVGKGSKSVLARIKQVIIRPLYKIFNKVLSTELYC